MSCVSAPGCLHPPDPPPAPQPVWAVGTLWLVTAASAHSFGVLSSAAAGSSQGCPSGTQSRAGKALRAEGPAVSW